jgi:hypothetical protein
MHLSIQHITALMAAATTEQQVVLLHAQQLQLQLVHLPVAWWWWGPRDAGGACSPAAVLD